MSERRRASRERYMAHMRAAAGVPAPRRERHTAADGATGRRYANTMPDTLALRGDPWAVGLAAITTTLHNMGVTHIRVLWWHPVFGTGERPPVHRNADSVFEVSWCVKVVRDDGTELCAGHSTHTTDHGVGIVEAGADCIRALMELRRAAA